MLVTDATVGGLCSCYVVVNRGLFLQWLGVTRASDFPVLCGRKLSVCFHFSLCIPNGVVGDAAPNKSPNVLSSVSYGVTRGSGSDPVVEMGALTSPLP